MELFVYSGFGQLPSIDFDCLRITVNKNIGFRKLIDFIRYHFAQIFLQAYVKFKEIPVKILTNGNPYHSSTGFLPYLKDHNEIVCGYDEIMEYFRSKVQAHV